MQEENLRIYKNIKDKKQWNILCKINAKNIEKLRKKWYNTRVKIYFLHIHTVL